MKHATVLLCALAVAGSGSALQGRQEKAALQGALAPDIVRWSDVKSPAVWYEVALNLVIPAVGDAPARIANIRAKEVTYTPSAGVILSAVTLLDPNSKQTCVLPSGEIYISDKDGVTAVAIDHDKGVLHVARSYVSTPDGEASAIQKFTTEFTAERVVEHSRASSAVSLAAVAPADFFARGGKPTWPDIDGYDVRQGVLRLDLRRYLAWGKFWIDLTALKVIRTEFGPGLSPSLRD